MLAKDCLTGDRQGIIFVISSPSGAGKTTLTKELLKSNKDISLSISTTTRPKRANEIHGKDYFFISKDEFLEQKKNGNFIETATVFGHLYGTPKNFVIDNLKAGIDVLFDVDWQGAEQLQSNFQDIVKVFLLPPSIDELRKRLDTRALDDVKTVENRMKKSFAEIEHWTEYDYVLINNNIKNCIEALMSILVAERLKRIRQNDLAKFVNKLLN